MTTATQYAGRTGAGRSWNLWHDCPFDAIRADPGIGYGFTEEFLHWGLPGTVTTLITHPSGYTVFGDTDATITPTEELGGGLKLLASVDAEHAAIEHDPAYNITQNGGPLWFEARVKVNNITTLEQSFLIGLKDTTALATGVPLTTANALADINLVGFYKPEANTTAFDAFYQADGVDAVEVNADIGAMVVNTYFKVGMKYDPKDSFRLKFFVDNVEQATAKVIPDATGTDFPADVNMGPFFCCGAGSTPDVTLTIDWWSCYQLRL